MNLLYNATDGCALISSNEGWGLSLTEAMICGKPIIAMQLLSAVIKLEPIQLNLLALAP